MAAHPAVHPSEDALRALALGKLNDSTASVLLSHLDDCPDCCKLVAALSGDDFLDRLRQARASDSTPAPPKSLVDVARAGQPPANPTPIPNLPPELAANSQYEILRELGRGGMGVVYLAKNKPMDRLEVLKVINTALLDHPGAVERFLREIRSAAKLSHTNVVTAYSVLQLGGLLAFAMEYIEGQDLASLVKSQGPLPVAYACYYVQQAALGLQHAHEEKMVHRDIKPQNLMLTHKGKKHIVKVLDFGLAKVMREKQDDTGLTGEGKMLGTPDYIAPEQTLDAAKADIRADIYSLGCTLYYLLSGRPPFSASSLGAMLMAHHSQEAKPLNLVRPEVPEELAAVVRKMMAKAPGKRYQTPLQVVQALAPFVKQRATAKTAPELSSGVVEAKPVAKKTARVDPTAVAAVQQANKQPETENVWGSLTEDSIASVSPRKSAVVRKPRVANKWLFGGGIAVGVLLVALLGMWAGGVFKVKTKDGILVVDVSEANPDVYVDGEKVTVSWDNGGKKAEIRVKPGTRKVEVKKDGFTVYGEEVEIEDGKRRVLTARLVRLSLPPGEKGGEHAPPAVRAANATGTELKRVTIDPPTELARFPIPTGVEQPVYGAWEVKKNELVRRAGWESRILFGDKTWTDYDFTVEGQMADGDCGFGVMVRNSGVKLYKHPQDGTTRHKDHLIFLVGGLANSHHYLEQVRGGNGQFLTIQRLKPDQRLKKGEWYTARVRVRGNHVLCYLNGDKLFDVFADPPPTGLVGLMTWTGSFRFRNIKVTDPSGKVLLEGLPDLK